jgi:hypothetical protein
MERSEAIRQREKDDDGKMEVKTRQRQGRDKAEK